MDIVKMIAEHHPCLERKLKSEQYALSDEIIKLKITHGLSQFDMATKMGIDFSTYLDMENGSTEINVSVYRDAIESFMINISP